MTAMGPDRFPPIPEAAWTEEQRRFAAAMIAGPRGALVSPFVPLLRSPELMDRVQATGEYLRYRSAIGRRLTELAILVTARHWDQPVEWAIHAPIAAREGIAPGTIEAIGEGRAPRLEREDEALVYDAARSLLERHRLPDELYERATTLFGARGVVDLLGVIGYYSMLSLVMNGAQTPVPEEASVRLPERRRMPPTP